MSIFKEHRDELIDLIQKENQTQLKFPLKKIGYAINNYNRGDFIVIGGRKTSGKSSFILNNYVISPLLQKQKAKDLGSDIDLKVVYINSRRSPKLTIEKMIVNYSSQKNNGTKFSIPTLYNYEGPHNKIKKDTAKTIAHYAMSFFEENIDNGDLSVISGRKTMYELENFIDSFMSEYGELDNKEGTFKYYEKYKDKLILVSIDDITGILLEENDSGHNFRNDNSYKLAGLIRSLAKLYNILIVLGVPSIKKYQRAGQHKSSIDEVFPYGIYADRSLIMHNPLESDDSQCYNYYTKDFINLRTGVNYFRSLAITSNYIGPTGIAFGIFMYPENGFMIELPVPSKLELDNSFTNLANSFGSPKKRKVKKDKDQDDDSDKNFEDSL